MPSVASISSFGSSISTPDGEMLLADAIAATRASIAGAGRIGLFADALHTKAAAFNRRYGFESFRDDPLRLFRPVAGHERRGNRVMPGAVS